MSANEKLSLADMKRLLEEEHQQTKEFDEFMTKEIQPKLTVEGNRHYELLHFFNRGYQIALEKVLHYIEELND